MLAITVPAPTAVAIARYGCRVVNRAADPAVRAGAVVAIHAAHRERSIYTETDRTSLLARVPYAEMRSAAQRARGRVVAIARIRGVVTTVRAVTCDRRWWVGPVGIVLTDVSPVEGMVSARAPVGNVGAWELPEDVVRDLERAVVEVVRPRPLARAAVGVPRLPESMLAAGMRRVAHPEHAVRRALGVCINNASHGPAWKGGRCYACWTAKESARRAGRTL